MFGEGMNMLLSQIKEVIDKKYKENPNLINNYHFVQGYIQSLKDFGVINLSDYWELKEYHKNLTQKKGGDANAY